MCGKFIRIVLCVVGYPMDRVMECRFLWVVLSFVAYPECRVKRYSFLWIVFCVVDSHGLCYVF